MTWKERIARANEGRFWKRGFTQEGRDRASIWDTCAVGEQEAMGRVRRGDLWVDFRPTRLAKLGSDFDCAVWTSFLFGRFTIRRAERLRVKIEDLALQIDFARVNDQASKVVDRELANLGR